MARKKESPKEDDLDTSLSLKDAVVNVSPLLLDGERATTTMTDVGWPSYVQSHFASDEVDEEGRPYVFGLRRVSDLLLGPTMKTAVKVMPAKYADKGLTCIVPAVAIFKATILYCRGEFAEAAHERVIADAADVNHLNADPAFARFAAAVAVTRAEARCYRKALRLRKPGADEMTKLEIPVYTEPEFADSNQLAMIEGHARKLGLNLMDVVNAGKTKYDRVEMIPFTQAQMILKAVSGWRNDPSTLPASLQSKRVSK